MWFFKQTTNKKKSSIFAHPFFLAEALFAAVMVAFSPCLKANLSNWDDQVHIYFHPLVDQLSWSNVGKMFQETVNGTYIPLTTLSFALEKHFFGYDPGLIHLVNMLLHSLVAVLIMLLGMSVGLTNRAAFLGALIFAVHPIHVESVAWATERKDVLYSSLYMAALLLWWRWLKDRKSGFLYLTFLAAGAALLAKPMAVSLPLIMALLAWFKDRLRSVPWGVIVIGCLLAAGIGSATYSQCARNPIANPAEAVLIWIWTAMFPLWKFFCPAILHPIYDIPQPIVFWHWPFVGSFALTGFLSWWIWRNRGDRLLLLAAGWYVLSTFFLYRFDVVDTHIVADRFMYLPSAGLCLWLGRRISQWLDGEKRLLAAGIVSVIFTLMALKTFAQCWVWYDGETLWSYVIENHPRREFAYNNRAIIYVTENRFDLAERDITQAILLSDNRPRVFYNRGMIFNLWAEALARQGRMRESVELYKRAVPDFSESIAAASAFPKSWNYRGLVKYRLGDYDGAMRDLNHALELDPGYSKAFNNRSKIYLAQHQFEKAAADNRQAIAFDPAFPQAYNDLAIAVSFLGNDSEAVQYLSRALELDPLLYEAWYNRSVLLERMGDRAGAERDRRRSRELGAQNSTKTKFDL